jgi:glutathione S-transferase
MPQPPTIRLYELILENGRSASPFVWRTRYALAHKGLPFESVPLGFTDIPRVLGAGFKTVPVLQDGEQRVGDSWDIAEYLDRAHADRPAIFTSPAERAMVRMFDAWFSSEILRRLFRLYVLDIHDAARPEDRAYFRQSREAWLKGATLESYVVDRESRLPAVRHALAPLRQHLSRGAPFIGGDSPNYADYIALGGFHWVASVSTLPLLASDDQMLCAWLERGFDLYGGLGRDARMKPLAA